MTDIGTQIKESGAIKRGKFQLSDGAMSDFYIDKYVFETQPELLITVRDAVIEQIEGQTFDVVAGPALGAIPIVTAVSIESRVESVFVRKSTGLRGTQARIEGDVDKGMRAIIIEDVTMTGETALESAKVLEGAGVTIESIVSVVDRDEGAADRISRAGYEFNSVVKVGENLTIE